MDTLRPPDDRHYIPLSVCYDMKAEKVTGITWGEATLPRIIALVTIFSKAADIFEEAQRRDAGQ